jgi:hypothetical protein
MESNQKTFDNSVKNNENYVSQGTNYTKSNEDTKFFDNNIEKNTKTYTPNDGSNNYEKTFDDNMNLNTNNELITDSNLPDTIQNM